MPEGRHNDVGLDIAAAEQVVSFGQHLEECCVQAIAPALPVTMMDKARLVERPAAYRILDSAILAVSVW